MELNCLYCGSENIYYSKKNNCYKCEDCEESFGLEKKFVPQKVFLSYGHDENAVLVQKIKKKLEERGHIPWIDTSEIKVGDEWRVKIMEGIQESNDFLAFASNYSTREPGVCLDEIAIGLGTRQCRIQTILLEKNVEVPNSISKIQWLDLSDWKDYFAQDELVWNNWFDSQINKLIEIIENPDNRKMSGEICELEQKLIPITPEYKIRAMMKSNIVSRKWLNEEIETWYKTNGSSKVFFLLGGPGTGKSVYCASLSNYLIDCGAIYFFEWNNIENNDISTFIKSIAFQLACNISDYRNRLMKIIDSIADINNEGYELFHRLIQEPLGKLIDGNRDKCVVVLDALDEINSAKRKEFIVFINHIIKNTPDWIKWVITSRPETDIIQGLRDYNSCFLYLNRNKIKHDIREYIKKYYKDDESISLILEKSEESFLYAKEIIETIKGDLITEEQLQKIPQGINSVYLNNFERIFTEGEYDCGYRNLLEGIVFSKAPVNTSLLVNVLGLDKISLKQKIEKLSSYLVLDDLQDGDTISVFHKTLVDWITTSNSGKFQIYEEDGHTLFANAFMKMVTTDAKPTEYMIKYGWSHLCASKIFKDILLSEKEKVLAYCIKGAKTLGLLHYEKKHIDMFADYCFDEITYYRFLLDYSVRSSGETNKKIADELLELSNSVKDEISRYQIREEVAVAYFYMGKDRESLELLKNERESYSKELWKNDDLLASYNHAVSLAAHDLDMNEDVIISASSSAKLYNKGNRNYDYFISIINLFDAYMGVGDFEKAEKYAKMVFRLNEDKYFIHVDDILKICYANLLSEENRIMEALDYYEEGLSISKDIQSWDYIYGSVWRELAIARFGDFSCLKRLLEYKELAKKENYEYLISLSDCFFILSSFVLDSYDKNHIIEAKRQVEELGLPGHMLQIKVALVMKEWADIDVEYEKKEILRLLSECQGVKGYPEILWLYAQTTKDPCVWRFVEKYISPIVQYQTTFKHNLFVGLDDEPYISTWSCAGCEAKCCYDGVYINDEEEQKIRKFVSKYPEYFRQLPQEFIVDGNWPGMEDVRKTATKNYLYTDNDYPKHFTHTRCVFASENGECILQRIATDKQMHPWAIKPRACWAFPLRGIRNGAVISPAKIGEIDPDYIDDDYPGYASFLPCGKAVDNGTSWKELFYREIEYFDYLGKQKK